MELNQFINYTSACCDLVVLAGDLNTPAGGLGYKLITENTDLSDTWVVKVRQAKRKREIKGWMFVDLLSDVGLSI